MKNPRNWHGLTEHWSLLLVGVFIFVAFSGLLARSLNRNTSLENVNILLPSSSTEFVLRPLNRDSLGISASSSFELKSPIPLHKEQIYANLKFEPAHNYKVIDLQDSWKITFDQPLEPNQLLKATLSSYIGQSISTSTAKSFSWSYQVKTPLAINNTIPTDQSTETPLDSQIIIRLSHDNFFDAAKHFSINPATNGSFTHVGRNLIFTPSEQLKPGTLYTIKLKKELPFAGTYAKLPADYAFSFETAATGIENTRDFSIESNLRRFPSDTSPIFDLQANRDGLEIATTLYAYDSADAYIKDLSDNALPWWSKSRTLSALNFLNGKEVLKFHQLVASSTLKFPIQLSSGFYLAKLSSKTTTNYVWFQVTDISVFGTLDYDKYLVWVNGNEGPIESANLQIFGADDIYQTNSKGVALFDTPKVIRSMLDTPTARQQVYLKASQDNKLAILPVFDFSSYKFIEERSAADKYAYSWRFEQAVYKPSDIVVLKGEISSRLNSPISTLDFTVQSPKNFTDYFNHHKPLYSSSTKINDNRFEIALPKLNYLPGDYLLSVSLNGLYVDRSYFHVSTCDYSSSSAPLPDNYQESINHYYKINEPIKTVFSDGSTSPVTARYDNYLHLKYKDGFRWYDADNSPSYETAFTPDMAPNFYLTSIHYDNGYFLTEPRLFLSELSTGTKNQFHPLTSGIWSQTATNLHQSLTIPANDASKPEAPSPATNSNCPNALPATINKLGTSSKLTVFQLSDGGLGLNPDGPSNLELSSLIALTSDINSFDLSSLYDFLLKKLESPSAKNEEMTFAMSGLIGLNEPLLNRLNSWINYRHDLSSREKIFLALALQKLGAQEWKNLLVDSIDIRSLSPAEIVIAKELE